MSPHPSQIADWMEQLNDAALRFANTARPIDAAMMALLARNIERAALDYLAKFNLKGVIDGRNDQ